MGSSIGGRKPPRLGWLEEGTDASADRHDQQRRPRTCLGDRPGRDHGRDDAAEFADRGIEGVSQREIAIAAGNGNTNVVKYHFGSKDDLVQGIFKMHVEQMEERRASWTTLPEGVDLTSGGSKHNFTRTSAKGLSGHSAIVLSECAL